MAEEIQADAVMQKPRSSWAEAWQLPVLLAGVMMLGVGLLLVMRTPKQADDYPGALDDIAKAIHVGEFEDARTKLTHLGEHLDKAGQADKARFELLSGDLIAQEIQSAPFEYDTPQNHERVVAHYHAADELGAEFDPQRLRNWVLTLVSLGKEEQALEMLSRFGSDALANRYQLLREMIERRLAMQPEDVAGLTKLLERFNQQVSQEPDANLRRVQEIWAVKVQADILLAGGQNERGIDMLLRHLAQFRAQSNDELALVPLMVRLAQAYQSTSDLAKAEQWFGQAHALVKNDPTQAINAEILVGMAQVTLAKTGDYRQALVYFTQAETDYPQADAYFEALLGRAHCEASLGSHEEAIEHLQTAVKYLVELPKRSIDREMALTGVVREHYQLNFDQHDYARALEYLSLVTPLHPERLPKELLADFAITHQRIAEQRLAEGDNISPAGVTDGPSAPDSIDARRLAYQQAAIHFGKSADYHFEYAQLVSAADDKAYGVSLWAAATNYDKAQLWKRAIEVYAQYVNTRGSDPMQLRAKHQLGLAYLADGQYPQASKLLAELIEDHPRSPEAYMSLVPLARAYTRMNKVDDALRVLRHVVTDHPTITRQSEEYRLALIDLGKLLYQQSSYALAIPYLAEALERYSDTPGGAGLRFRLADAYRQSVPELDRQLSEPMNTSSKAALQQERRDRLTKAQVLYSQVVSELESQDPRELTPLDKLFHRNAYFYRADCAYDLGQYEQAISLYDLAAKRWDKDPSSLVALVQIVNANSQLNRVQAARVANARARERLKQIPDEAFDDVTIPMTRRHWEEWLKWSSQLDLPGPQASRE